MKWIIIIAVSCSGISGITVTDNTYPTFNHTDLNYPILRPSAPDIKVFYVNTKEEAEHMATGYYSGLYCSFSSIVIDPAGKVFNVKYIEKKKTVLKEVVETVGYELVWEEHK